jgi:hypothetical protein
MPVAHTPRRRVSRRSARWARRRGLEASASSEQGRVACRLRRDTHQFGCGPVGRIRVWETNLSTEGSACLAVRSDRRRVPGSGVQETPGVVRGVVSPHSRPSCALKARRVAAHLSLSPNPTLGVRPSTKTREPKVTPTSCGRAPFLRLRPASAVRPIGSRDRHPDLFDCSVGPRPHEPDSPQTWRNSPW